MSRVIAIVAASLLALIFGAGARADAAADAVTLQLHGPTQFEFAGYYAALWQGYYRDAGLAVTIRPAAAPGQAAPDDAVQEVASGKAQFGTGGLEVLVRAAQGLPLLLLAPIFQQSGVLIYYRADGDFSSPPSLLKARVGRLPASDPLDLELVTALRGDGLDPARLKTVSLARGQQVSALADKLVDAAAGSVWELPWLARARNLALKSLNPADYRVEFYGDTLFTLQRYARSNPDLVARFRAASLKGWAYALDHADEIGRRMNAELPPPAVPEPALFARYQAEVARRLARYPEVPIGHSSPARWARIEASLAAAGAVVPVAAAESYVYDPDAAARRDDERRRLLVFVAAVGGAVGMLIVAAYALVRIGRRQGRRTAAIALLPPPRPQTAPSDSVVDQPAAPSPVPAPVAAVAAAPPAAEAPAVPEPVATEPVAVDLNAMLKRLEPTIRERVPERIGVRLSLLPEAWPCTLDREVLAGLVLELVGDAGADMKPGDDLIVGTRNYAFDPVNVRDTPGARVGEFARITVRDSGRGLPNGLLERVFDPSVTSRPAASAAWLLTRKLGGFTRVESAEGVGTAVHLYFPRFKQPAPAPATTGRKRYRLSGGKSTHRRSRSLS